MYAFFPQFFSSFIQSSISINVSYFCCIVISVSKSSLSRICVTYGWAMCYFSVSAKHVCVLAVLASTTEQLDMQQSIHIREDTKRLDFSLGTMNTRHQGTQIPITIQGSEGRSLFVLTLFLKSLCHRKKMSPNCSTYSSD